MAATRVVALGTAADMVHRVTAGRAAYRAMVDVPQVGADIIRRRAEVDVPTAAAGAPLVAVEVTPLAAVAGIRVVAAVIPAAEDMAAVIAKKLGDGMSLREAAT